MANTDFLYQLADYIDRENLGDTSGGASNNIFVGHYPDDPDNIIAFLGLIGQSRPNQYIKNFEYPRFQVVVRNTDYEDGAGKMREIRNLLHDKLNLVTENFVALYIQADQDFYPIGQDKKGRFEFSINFTCQIRNDDSI